MVQFAKASKKKAKARIAISGPSGSGKTWTSLLLAKVLAEGGIVAVIDTEHGSASLYSDTFDFETCDITSYEVGNYISAIKAAEDLGAAVIVIDSLSHAWSGKGGVRDQVDMIAARMKSQNTFPAWKDGTKLQQELISAILSSKCHVIATMRSKTEYAMDTNDRGRVVPRKIGLAPDQRADTEYEFTIALDMDQENRATVSKTRCSAISGKVFAPPDESLGRTILNWLNDGAEAPKEAPAPKPEEKPAGFGIDPKAPASVQIANVTVPGLLIALLTTWKAQHSIPSRPDWWEKVHKASVDKYSKMGWEDGDLVDCLNAIKEEIARATPPAAPAI